MIGYLQIAAVIALAVFALKAWNGWKHETQVRVTAQIEKQVADSALDAERDSKREVAALLAKRPARQEAIAKVQAKRKTDEATQRKTDPAYGDWARIPVPQSVVDELRQSARAASGVHSDAGNGKPGPVVRPESTGTASDDGRRRLAPLRPSGT